MKHTILAAIVLATTFLNITATAAPMSHHWSRRYGDTVGQNPQRVVADIFGNVYVTGYFYGTVDFGGGNLTATGAGADVFLAKFNSSGTYLWSVRFGDASDQEAYGIGTDGEGSVYIGGVFQGGVNFGGSTLTSAGDRDIFIAKFNSDGVHQWSKRFGDAAEQRCVSMSVDLFGQVYATGYFLGSVDFGGGALNGTGSYQVFLASLDLAGAHRWSMQFGDAADQRGSTVVIDIFGTLYVAGPFNGTINFGGGNLTSAGGSDIYLAKFNSAGTHQWSKRFGDGDNQEARAVAVDHWGCVYLTGGMSGTADFGGGPLTSAGGYDAFLARFTAAGVHDWSKRFGDGGMQYGTAVAATELGEAYLAGNFDSTINLGAGSLPAIGITDFFLAKFDVWGIQQWSRRYGAVSKVQDVTSIAADPVSDLLATGLFQGTIDLGGGSLASAGSNDAFVAKFGPMPSGVTETPTTLAISSHPNPFNPETTVRYTLPAKSHVTVAVYDIRGAIVATLVDMETDAGPHSVVWKGRDDHGNPVGSGVYFARLVSPAGSRSYKMTLLK